IDKAEKTEEERVKRMMVQPVKSMPVAGWDQESLTAAARLLVDQILPEKAAEFYYQAVKQQWEKEKKVNGRALVELLGLTQDTFRTPEHVEAFAREFVPRTSEKDAVRAEGYILLSRLQGDLGKDDAAYTSARAALEQLDKLGGGEKDMRRRALIAVGGAARSLGKREEAVDAYRQAQSLPAPGQTRPYDVSSFALTAEAYIRAGEFEFAEKEIDQWVSFYPLEQVVGYASILQARVYEKTGKRDLALREVETFLKCEPKGIFERDALELAGDLCLSGGNKKQARVYYKKVLDGFQDEKVRARIESKMGRM
ncbi:tetratricopeptide repeat protein, partial [bacterium]|nr:tetratricopeptide repeat protein [bacterium]